MNFSIVPLCRRLSRRAAILAVCLLSFSGRIGAADTSARPNFLILIADDLTWRDLGVTGNKDIKTPRIDRLAGESMNLRGMFTPVACCSPARHALYTGLFPVRSGAYPHRVMLRNQRELEWCPERDSNPHFLSEIRF